MITLVLAGLALWTGVLVVRARGNEGSASAYGISRAAVVEPSHLVYFHSPGCMDCVAATQLVLSLERERPDLRVSWISADEPSAPDLRMALNERHGVDGVRTIEIPALFGTKGLVGPKEVLGNAREEFGMLPVGAAEPRYFLGDESEPPTSAPALPPLLWVAIGGVVDGISPCAVATLVLFASWVALRCRTLAMVLRAFATFGAGVVLVYSLAGLGFYAILARTLASPTMRLLGQAGTALVVMILAVILFEDANRARLGCTEDLLMKVGAGGRDVSRRAMRWAGRSGFRTAAAIGAGALVGGIELTCTGVVYLPMLAYLASSGAPPAYVGAALATHNLAFLIPLAAVTVAAWHASKRAGAMLTHPHAVARVRLLTGTAMLLLGGWMIWTAAGTVGLG